MWAPRVNFGTGREQFRDEGDTETLRSIHHFPEALRLPIALSKIEFLSALRRC